MSHWVYPLYLYKSAYKPGKNTENIRHHVITHVQEEIREVTLGH